MLGQKGCDDKDAMTGEDLHEGFGNQQRELVGACKPSMTYGHAEHAVDFPACCTLSLAE